MSTIGFIGLGNMGGPMAANLVRHGHEVRGFDLSAASLETAAGLGVVDAASARDAAEGAEIVVTMLPAGAHVVAVYRDLLASMTGATGKLFIDSSTIDVASARQAHTLAAEAGARALDAPVSGGTGGAAAGTLTFMAGGSDAAFAEAQPVLAAMGRRIVHCGGPGAGQAAKICNNMILGVSMIAVCEAFVLGEALGLSNQALFDVASTSSGQCWALTTNCPVPGPVAASPANRDYAAGFAAALMLKDLRLAHQAAEGAGVTASLGGRAAELYGKFADAGHGGLDFSAIIQAIRAQSTGDAA